MRLARLLKGAQRLWPPTREEAGEKGRLMLLPRRHWLPSAGNNAVLFSPGSCSDQQNGLALLSSAWRQCPILSFSLLSSPHLPPPTTPVTSPSLPPPASLPSVILATFPRVHRALTKKLSAQPAPVTESSHTPPGRDESRGCVDRVPRLQEVAPLSHTECRGFTPQSPRSSKALNEIIYSVAFALSFSPLLPHSPHRPLPPPSLS